MSHLTHIILYIILALYWLSIREPIVLHINDFVTFYRIGDIYEQDEL